MAKVCLDNQRRVVVEMVGEWWEEGGSKVVGMIQRGDRMKTQDGDVSVYKATGRRAQGQGEEVLGEHKNPER